MLLLFAITSWTLVLSLIASLCVVAREGDRQHDGPTPRSEVGELREPNWSSELHLERSGPIAEKTLDLT